MANPPVTVLTRPQAAQVQQRLRQQEQLRIEELARAYVALDTSDWGQVLLAHWTQKYMGREQHSETEEGERRFLLMIYAGIAEAPGILARHAQEAQG